VAVLTVNIPFENDLLLKVDKCAQKEDRSREDIINQATEIYLRAKEWDEICADGRKHALKCGITDDVINEEIKLYRKEQECSNK